VIKHRRVRVTICQKLGLSKPRCSGFNCGDLNLENRDLAGYWKLVVDGGREYQGGYSASNSLLFGVGREGSGWMRDIAELSVG